MADALVSPKDAPNPPNKHGEKLVGMLHHGGSNKVVVLCHGFAACKDDSIMIDLASALTKQGISAFRFDFSGNGESEGEFQYGNYRKEADDLHSVFSYLYQEKYDVTAIVGYSKGKVLYRVTKESLMERLNTDMHAASLSISKECRFFTIHGSADKIIPAEDAYEFARLIPNHKLHIIRRANHGYTSHRREHPTLKQRTFAALRLPSIAPHTLSRLTFMSILRRVMTWALEKIRYETTEKRRVQMWNQGT